MNKCKFLNNIFFRFDHFVVSFVGKCAKERKKVNCDEKMELTTNMMGCVPHEGSLP